MTQPRPNTMRSRLSRFALRSLRRVAVVLVGLIAGWVAAGYAEGHLPGTVAYSPTVRTAPPATQPFAKTQPNQPTTTSPTPHF